MLTLITALIPEVLKEETPYIVRLSFKKSSTVKVVEQDLKYRLGGRKDAELQTMLENKYVFLLIDNIEKLNECKEGSDIRTWLRELSEMRSFTTIRLITTSQKPLKEIIKDHFQPIHETIKEFMKLEPFSLEDGRAFISSRLSGTPFNIKNFENLLFDPNRSIEHASKMLPRNLEDACQVRYDELCMQGTTQVRILYSQ